MNEYFIKFECIIICKGKLNCILLDLQRSKYYQISHKVIDVLEKYDGKKLPSVKTKKDDLEIINFLIQKEIGFLGDKNDTKLFIKLDTRFYYPLSA